MKRLAANKEILYDVVPTIRSFNYTTGLNPTDKELVFVAEDIPAHGLKLFYVQTVPKNKSKVEESRPKAEQDPNYFGDKVRFLQ